MQNISYLRITISLFHLKLLKRSDLQSHQYWLRILRLISPSFREFGIQLTLIRWDCARPRFNLLTSQFCFVCSRWTNRFEWIWTCPQPTYLSRTSGDLWENSSAKFLPYDRKQFHVEYSSQRFRALASTIWMSALWASFSSLLTVLGAIKSVLCQFHNCSHG